MGSLLSRPTAERMVTPFIAEYGLGFAVETHGSERYFSHGGADEGFQAYLVAHRGGWGAAVMTNSDNGIALAVEILRGLARQEGWKGYLPEPLVPLAPSPDDLRALAGRYRVNGDEALSLESRGSRVFGRSPVDPEFELYPVEGDRLVRKDRAIRYGVLRSNGAVRALEIETDEARSEAARMPPGETIPFDHVVAGRLEEAMSAYRALKAARPDDPGVAEARLNRLGYQLAARQERGPAIIVLQVNTALYPGLREHVGQPGRGAAAGRPAGPRPRVLSQGARGAAEGQEVGRGGEGAAPRQRRAPDRRAVGRAEVRPNPPGRPFRPGCGCSRQGVGSGARMAHRPFNES